MCNSCWSSDAGLATLDHRGTRLRGLLDECFVAIARKLAAVPMQFPPILRVSDVDNLDYFVNFPQLPLAVSSTRSDVLHERRLAHTGERWESLDPGCLADATHILPPAACYAVYVHHRDGNVGALRSVTTLANCFRREAHYVGLTRLKSFTMREIVFLGEMQEVTEALSRAREAVSAMTEFLAIPIRTENASDPFFDPNSARAITQKLFPVKQELVFGDDLAIASANFHRNFFGERFSIAGASGGVAFTACIGMGLERWIHALLAVYGDQVETAMERVAAYLERLSQTALPSAVNG